MSLLGRWPLRCGLPSAFGSGPGEAGRRGALLCSLTTATTTDFVDECMMAFGMSVLSFLYFISRLVVLRFRHITFGHALHLGYPI